MIGLHSNMATVERKVGGVCRGHQCITSALIKAHIIPRGFARYIKSTDSPHNILILEDNVRPTQHGVFDPALLCQRCDGVLGKLDHYGVEVCRRFPGEHKVVDHGDMFEMENVDGDKFAKFILSVLWRASVTTRPEFRRVSLGPYDALACEVIFGAKSLSAIPAYELLVGRYEQMGKMNPARTYSSPARGKILDDLNGWTFALGGFRIMAKFDRRRFPALLTPAIVNGNTKLMGVFGDFRSTVEGQTMAKRALKHGRMG